MTAQRPPARPWYNLVVDQAAVRGWSISELARRAKIGRPTIYGWRDGSEGKIQAGPVNAVADTLGIPRERALRLAGIIGGGEPDSPPSTVPKSLVRDIMNTEELTDDQRRAVIAAVERTLARERGEGDVSVRDDAAARPEHRRHRPASL